jgi:flagellar hook-basal body complex protein FliE
MVNLNANVSEVSNAIRGVWKSNSAQPKANPDSFGMPKVGSPDTKNADFTNAVKAVENYISTVDDLQQSSDMSIKDLLSGKNEDILLLVGVRNKLIEAYKQTMNMPL